MSQAPQFVGERVGQATSWWENSNAKRFQLGA